ncbi:uncharacterized protein LOC119078912 [Bradysia coprophila]|uniref:uncharacterized protein LOC119078912 n=1 Tax=Bradysia coprophila TaxID=38358 RepID=UPI00187D854C|nr:uncharacterized protein LOC119078912 [Bradysia coprophila]
MSNNIVLSFVVLLAISFVHSFPKLEGSDENAQIAKLMSVMKNLNVTSLKALSKLKDKSGESGESDESVEGYIDMFFDLVFEEDDSSEENTDLAFGPDFDPSQFFALLSNDVERSFQRKCKKISGSDETFGKIKAASKDLGQCLKSYVKSEEMRAAYSNLKSEEDFHTLIKTLCRTRHVAFKCVDNSMEVNAQCSFPSEIEFDNSIRRIVYGLLDVTCANDGNDFISLITGQGRQCLQENLNELKTCQYKEIHAILKGLIVKLIEYERFEWKMDADDCKSLGEIQSCFESAVENCVEANPKNYVTSFYQVLYNETECAQITPIQAGLLN